MIDAVEQKWKRQGKRTHRNWWSVLAGKKDGSPRHVSGILFPVLRVAQVRQGGKVLSPGKIAPDSLSRRTRGKGRIAASKPAKDARALSNTSHPKPFVKWAGGKRQLLTEIRDLVPLHYRTYHEPFLGGGAVFFELSPASAFLSDSNERLVRCYAGIQKHVDEVISLLEKYSKKRSRQFFLHMRKWDIDQASDAEVAAWFIFLNKTGFNGLYRVNSKNLFNVPYGDNENAQIYDEENLKACSSALAHAKIECGDYSAVLNRAEPGDLVYFDPPYMPLSATSYFTSYTAKGFTREDQIKLRDVALQLKQRGVHVLLSNSSSAAEFYPPQEFSRTRVMAARPVNSNAAGRGKIEELLITPR
jgi:DNA adenine methylase